MCKIIKPPLREEAANFSIFLAGSIDNGAAENWQKVVESFFSDMDVTIYNPRRDLWDPTWQYGVNQELDKQIRWELDYLDKVDLILFYFAPNSSSPVTLLELGLCSNKNILVACPNAYWRAGNVKIVCERKGIKLFQSLEPMLFYAKTLIK